MTKTQASAEAQFRTFLVIEFGNCFGFRDSNFGFRISVFPLA